MSLPDREQFPHARMSRSRGADAQSGRIVPIYLEKLGETGNYTHPIAATMSGEVRTDERGRVTIPKEVRDRYGDRYRLVQLDSGIKLVPIPDDPLAELQAAASDDLREASIEDLEEAAGEEAREQAGNTGTD